MSSAFLTVLLYTTVPVVAAFLGSVIAAYRELSPNLRSAIQHLAAGIVFAVASVEMLPDVEKGSPVMIIIGFAVGVAVMLAIKKFGQRLEEAESGASKWPTGMLAAVGVDRAIDGLVLGIGFAAAAKLGVILTIGISLEVLFVAVAIAATLKKNGLGTTAVIATPVGLSLSTMLFAIIGSVALQGLSPENLAPVLAFGAAALLYLVTEELLSEAHEVADTIFSTTMFFVGFLAFLVLDMLTA